MKNFDTELNKDLLIIIEKLNTEKDPEKRKILLSDKEIILKMLNVKRKKSKEAYEKTLDGSELTRVLIDNKANFLYFKKIKFLYINVKKISTLTKSFIDKSDSNLSKTYKKIVSYGGIKTFNEPRFYAGVTRYIESLDKNYIQIVDNQTLTHYTTKIHELAHARVNSMCRTIEQKFIEVYPVFLELLFSEHLKNNGLLKESYNIKVGLLNELKKLYNELNEESLSFLDDKRGSDFDKYIYEYKYDMFKEYILAFYLFDMYLTNPEETLINVDFFILNLSKKSEEELLNIFGLDKTYLNDNRELFNKIYEMINIERNLIINNINIFSRFNKNK